MINLPWVKVYPHGLRGAALAWGCAANALGIGLVSKTAINIIQGIRRFNRVLLFHSSINNISVYYMTIENRGKIDRLLQM